MIGSAPQVGPNGTFVAFSGCVTMTGPSAAAAPTSASAAETLATEMMRSLVMVLPPFGCVAGPPGNGSCACDRRERDDGQDERPSRSCALRSHQVLLRRLATATDTRRQAPRSNHGNP